MRRPLLFLRSFCHGALRAAVPGALAAMLLTAGSSAAARPPAKATKVALPSANRQAEEPLYFALELKHDGKVLATPKLLGTPGKWIRAERRLPGASNPDYKLSLLPTAEGAGFRIDLDLLLPHAKLAGKADAVPLEHGEERSLKWGAKSGKLEVTMLVMRVRSPEFRALMGLTNGDEAKQPEMI